MSSITILRQSVIERTPRVMQLEGLFDISPASVSVEKWDVDIELPREWNVGLIVGPSGSGKTTLANELFGDAIGDVWEWPLDRSIVDGFPSGMSIKEITGILSSVGFSSPPSWLRPYRALSNGEQFRAIMARTLAEMPELCVVDEFTSVVDRTVAQIASAAIQKTVRRRQQKFVAVSCHYDVAEWLEPDWIYEPHLGRLTAGRLLRRPQIELQIKRVHYDAWRIFRKHHYLNTELNVSSRCFCAFLNDSPVAFSAILHFTHPRRKKTKREHRTVTLPDYQGVGIGNALSDAMGAMCKSLGYSFISTTSHPGMIQSRTRSNRWKMTRNSSLVSGGSGREGRVGLRASHAWKRYTASFEYVGDAMDTIVANRLWNDSIPPRTL